MREEETVELSVGALKILIDAVWEVSARQAFAEAVRVCAQQKEAVQVTDQIVTHAEAPLEIAINERRQPEHREGNLRGRQCIFWRNGKQHAGEVVTRTSGSRWMVTFGDEQKEVLDRSDFRLDGEEW